MKKEEVFWNWFRENEQAYHFFCQMPDSPKKEALTKTLLEKLHEYCNKLSFEIIFNAYDLDKEYFVITTRCDVNYFEQAYMLNDYAPNDLPHWIFRALIPPAREFTESYIFDFGNISLNPDTVWFRPMVSELKPNLLGVTIYFKEHDQYQENPYLPRAVQELLSMELGEEVLTLGLHHLQIAPLPPDPEKHGMSKLHNLLKFINWYHNNRMQSSKN